MATTTSRIIKCKSINHFLSLIGSMGNISNIQKKGIPTAENIELILITAVISTPKRNNQRFTVHLVGLEGCVINYEFLKPGQTITNCKNSALQTAIDNKSLATFMIDGCNVETYRNTRYLYTITVFFYRN